MSLYVDHEGSCLNVPCGEEPPARTLHQANLPGGAPALPDIGELLQGLLVQELQVHGLLVQKLRGSSGIEMTGTGTTSAGTRDPGATAIVCGRRLFRVIMTIK
jgi:hypothetical protein